VSTRRKLRNYLAKTRPEALAKIDGEIANNKQVKKDEKAQEVAPKKAPAKKAAASAPAPKKAPAKKAAPKKKK
jgi:hypothetical protein